MAVLFGGQWLLKSIADMLFGGKLGMGWQLLAAFLCILTLCSAWSAHTQLLVGPLSVCMLPVGWEPCAALCHLTSTTLLASYTLAPMQAGHYAR